MKKSQTFKIKGELVRDCRQNLGMSQTALAEGICTQATVSLIEQKNKMPKMPTLIALARRLNLDVEELIVRDLSENEEQIAKAEDALHQYQFGKALHTLNQIKVSKLTDVGLRQRYHYLLGGLYLFSSQNVQKAMEQFSAILAIANRREVTVPVTLAKLGLGVGFARMGQSEQTGIYMHEVKDSLTKLRLDANCYSGEDITMLWYQAQCELALGEPAHALRTIRTALKKALKAGRLYLLDEIYMTYSECCQASGSRYSEEGMNAESCALTLAGVVGNDQLVNRIVAKCDESVVAN